MRNRQQRSGSNFWLKTIAFGIVAIIVYRCSTSKIDQPEQYNTSTTVSSDATDFSNFDMLNLNELSSAERKNYTGEGEYEFLFKTKRYRGEWVSGKPSGNGEMWWSNGDYAIGEFYNGVLHGQAIKKYTSGSVYSGSFSNNNRHGSGKLVYPNGVVQEGHWDNDRFLRELLIYNRN